MEVHGPTRRAVFGIVMVSIAMLLSLLIPTQPAEASLFSGPCPSYSIQDVFDDPNGNWDGDQVKNSDELYNGLNPCLVDTADFCSPGGISICTYAHRYTHGRYVTRVQKDIVNNPCHRSAFTRPHDDYDRDGVTNQAEIAKGTDPCIYNAPVHVVVQAACPHYTVTHITNAPHYDWDGDGVTNMVEYRQGTNPCVFNGTVVYQAPRVRTTTVIHRLPHVVNTYTPPQRQVVRPLTTPLRSVPARVCPAGYPYFHPANGQCYANPIKQLFN